jgi:hypothetical protein
MFGLLTSGSKPAAERWLGPSGSSTEVPDPSSEHWDGAFPLVRMLV